ncbi:MAG: hypothetical protein PHX61_08150 [Alphaproteobacteria bacterium]|nr:hypothetical protein [Alphaproteobacteria bacterium]
MKLNFIVRFAIWLIKKYVPNWDYNGALKIEGELYVYKRPFYIFGTKSELPCLVLEPLRNKVNKEI